MVDRKCGGVSRLLSYLNRTLSKEEKKEVIKYMKQYNNISAIIEAKKLDSMPSITSSIKDVHVQESNAGGDRMDKYLDKMQEIDELLEVKKKLDVIYDKIKPIQKLIWDDNIINNFMDADLYYGHDITKRTYYREKNELLILVAECLEIGTK